MLDVFEYVFSISSDDWELEENAKEYDLENLMRKSSILCDTDLESGLISSPHVNAETKQRMLEIFGN